MAGRQLWWLAALAAVADTCMIDAMHCRPPPPLRRMLLALVAVMLLVGVGPLCEVVNAIAPPAATAAMAGCGDSSSHPAKKSPPASCAAGCSLIGATPSPATLPSLFRSQVEPPPLCQPMIGLVSGPAPPPPQG